MTAPAHFVTAADAFEGAEYRREIIPVVIEA